MLILFGQTQECIWWNSTSCSRNKNKSVTSITGNSNQVFQDSGVSASITPSSTSNKILIMANLTVGAQIVQGLSGKLVSVIGGTTYDIFRADVMQVQEQEDIHL